MAERSISALPEAKIFIRRGRGARSALPVEKSNGLHAG